MITRGCNEHAGAEFDIEFLANVSTHGFIRADIVEPDARAVTGLIRRTIHNAPDVVQRPISRR